MEIFGAIGMTNAATGKGGDSQGKNKHREN
jgi:hypothetical protein